MPHADSIWMRA